MRLGLRACSGGFSVWPSQSEICWICGLTRSNTKCCPSTSRSVGYNIRILSHYHNSQYVYNLLKWSKYFRDLFIPHYTVVFRILISLFVPTFHFHFPYLCDWAGNIITSTGILSHWATQYDHLSQGFIINGGQLTVQLNRDGIQPRNKTFDLSSIQYPRRQPLEKGAEFPLRRPDLKAQGMEGRDMLQDLGHVIGPQAADFVWNSEWKMLKGRWRSL